VTETAKLQPPLLIPLPYGERRLLLNSNGILSPLIHPLLSPPPSRGRKEVGVERFIGERVRERGLVFFI